MTELDIVHLTIPTQTERPKPKKRFRAEVSRSLTDYYLAFANVRYHFSVQPHKGTKTVIEPKQGFGLNEASV